MQIQTAMLKQPSKSKTLDLLKSVLLKKIWSSCIVKVFHEIIKNKIAT